MPENPPPSEPAARRDKDVAELGAGLCKWLYAATKLGGMWGYDGKVAQEAIHGLVAALRECGSRHGESVLRVASEQIFLNDQRLRMDFAGLLAFRAVLDLYVSREIGEIRFGSSLSEREVVGLLKALNGVPRDCEEPRPYVEKALAAEGVRDIAVGAPKEIDEGADDRKISGIRGASIESYFRAVYVASQLRGSLNAPEGVEVRKAKRVVHALVDLFDRDETTLLALAQVKNFGDYGATHAANVTILSIAMAKRIEAPKVLLGEMGVAGLLHDVGRRGEDDDVAVMDSSSEDHTRRGARALLCGMGYSDGSLRLLLATRHHHENATRTGGVPAPLTHRIVRVADFFDTATTPAGEGRPALAPKKALRMMLRDPDRFDGKLVKVLAAVVGQYPFGTLVQLDSGERAVVCGRNPHFESPSRPIVRVVVDENGNDLEEPRTVDLSMWDREEKRFAHSIVEAYPPSQAYSDPSEYIKTI